MAWIQFIFNSSPDKAEFLSDALNEIGAAAVTFEDNADQPIYEPAIGETPLWSATRVIALFDEALDRSAILSALQLQMADQLIPAFKVEAIEDKDWERAWMDSFTPMQFGEKLWIVPSWHQAPDTNAINILLDPGLAFGTGTHATTALCLEWLDGVDLTGKTVIDYGCGSGILAIAAALKGAQRIICVDTDLQALTATQANAERNKVTVETYLPDACPAMTCDLVLANILAGPLMALKSVFATFAQDNTEIVLSGILESQAEQVSRAYQPNFEMQDPVVKDEWVRLYGYYRGH